MLRANDYVLVGSIIMVKNATAASLHLTSFFSVLITQSLTCLCYYNEI